MSVEILEFATEGKAQFGNDEDKAINSGPSAEDCGICGTSKTV